MTTTAKSSSTQVVICGAGIAGISAAYHLTVRHGVKDVVLVDERPPLTLTSDKSTEAYRNWWPGPDGAMVGLMNRSIDLLEELAAESANVFHLNRRGYLYATADPERAAGLEREALRAEELGAGPLRRHTGAVGKPTYVPHHPTRYEGQPDGADLILGRELVRHHFPYLNERTLAVLHARRCGWFSGQQLGMHLLKCARENGARILRARVVGVELSGGRVDAVRISHEGHTEELLTRHFVNAAGPMLRQVGAMLDVDLPVYSERHLKAAFADPLEAVPRDAPFMVWEDGQRLAWSEEERRALGEDEETRRLLEELPPGVHCRPEGPLEGTNVLMLWSYHAEPVPEIFPLPEESSFPEVVLRGMSTMVPGLAAYLEKLPRPFVDGGYYTRTRENRLLCGALPMEGAWVLGALSGYGLMASCAAGELLALHLTGGALPTYAAAFLPSRYDDPAYLKRLETWGGDGQL